MIGKYGDFFHKCRRYLEFFRENQFAEGRQLTIALMTIKQSLKMHQRIPQEQKDPAVLRPHVIRNILFWLQIFFQFCKSSELEINEAKSQAMVLTETMGIPRCRQNWFMLLHHTCGTVSLPICRMWNAVGIHTKGKHKITVTQ